MAAKVKLNGSELLEVDICDVLEAFSGFQRWTSPADPPPPSPPPSPPSAAPGRQELPAGHSDSDSPADGERAPRSSIVDCLLVELYETCGGGGGRRHADSWESSTEASGSDAFPGRSNAGSGFLLELQEKHTRRHQVNYLAQKDPEELRSIIQEAKYRSGLQSAKLIRQLRRRDRLCHKLQKNYDIITACLQAVSQKRRSGLIIVTGCLTSPHRSPSLPLKAV